MFLLPDRKKSIVIGIIAVILIVVIVFAIYTITKFIKGGVEKPFLSAPYPLEYKYVGIQYDEVNKYQTLVVLKDDFTKDETTNLKSFFEIKNLKVKNNRLYFYSDAINEVAYDSEKEEFLIHEVNSYYNNKTTLKLADDYIIFLTEEGHLEYRSFDAKETAKNEVITTNLIDYSIAVVANYVFYHDPEGLIAYDMDSKTFKNLVTETYAPTIMDYNEEYLLLKTDDEYFIFNINSEDMTFLDIVAENLGTMAVSLYSRGFVYEKTDMEGIKRLYSYNAFFQRHEEASYKIEDGYDINYMYNIDGSFCYMDLVNKEDEHKYYIIDVENTEIVATLDEAYQYIKKVQ